MSKGFAAAVVWLALGSSVGQTLQGRTWTEAATGRKLEAELVSADEKSVVLTRGGQRFTLPLEKLSVEDQAVVREHLAKAGAKPEAVVKGKKIEDRFEDMPKLKAEEIPVNGVADARFEPVDAAIREFMAQKGIGALTFAVSKDGKILHERAFGWAEEKLKTPLQPGVKMRMASMTKPVVKAAINWLFTENRLKPEDKVFDVLKLGELKEAKDADERWKQITIEQLLEHRGGWDRDAAGDISFNTEEIAALAKVKLDKITPEHVMRYGLTKPLDFVPGAKNVYSNYGYVVLVRVIERVSGKDFITFLQETVMKEAGATSFIIGASRAEDRQPDEGWYCYHPEYVRKDPPLLVRSEARDGAGGLASTAADYCRFLEKFWINGERRDGRRFNYNFFGSLPGITAVSGQRAGGINYAAMANRRGMGGEGLNAELNAMIDAALDSAVK